MTGVQYRHPGSLLITVTTLDTSPGAAPTWASAPAGTSASPGGLGVPFPPTAERFERLEETLEIALAYRM